MDDASRTELESLRARAYGPAADIGSDPAALARLNELESAARTGRAARAAARAGSAVPGGDRFAPVPVRPSPPVPTTSAAEAAAERQIAGGTGHPDSRPRRTPGSRRTSGTRRLPVRVLWPLTVAGAALIAAGVTYGILAGPVAATADSGPQEIQTLHLTTAAVADDIVGDTDATLVGADFHGYTVVRMPPGASIGGPDVPCLLIVETAGNGGDLSAISGAFFVGCAAGSLPATVQVPVTDSSPEELLGLYPVGTGLKFVENGDTVHVYRDAYKGETSGARS
jgi:hypothetical protein